MCAHHLSTAYPSCGAEADSLPEPCLVTSGQDDYARLAGFERQRFPAHGAYMHVFVWSAGWARSPGQHTRPSSHACH
eukprot:364280-Chlamydomonas_euryale.AAC.6